MGRSSARLLLYGAAALSLLAAFIHLWVMPGHFAEWWGYGTFFLLAAVAQTIYAAVLLRRPDPRLFAVGIVGNLAIIGLWVVTRTVGIPFFGPHAGEIETVGGIDGVANLVEVTLVVILGLLLWRAGATPPGSRVSSIGSRRQ